MSQKDFKYFINEWKYLPLSIVSSGCGSLIASLLDIPGSSNVIADIKCINDYNSLIHTITDTEISDRIKSGGSCVNQDVAEAMAIHTSMDNHVKRIESLVICVTGALTTNKWRKGDNRAFISVCASAISNHTVLSFKLDIPKLLEMEYNDLPPDQLISRRKKESLIVAYAIMNSANTYSGCNNNEFESLLRIEGGILTELENTHT